MAPLPVDIWSDVICPWCYIGKRRFEAALARFEHRDEVTVTWHAFELDPDAPRAQEGSLAEGLAAKYGMSVEEAQASHVRLTELAAEEGLDYHFELAQRGNTFDAHRLVAAGGGARPSGRDDGAPDARLLHRGRRDRRPRDARAAGRRGGDRRGRGAHGAGRRALLGSEVREDEQTGTRIGIRGVPFFVLDRRFGVSGAQPADALLQALEHAWTPQGEAAA